jgi:hypothetical protein
MATNTIAGVNPQRIAKLTLDALQTTVLPLTSAFVTNFSDEIAESGNTVTTRFVTNPSVQNFATARAAQNSVTTARTVTLDKYVGVDVGFSDTEVSFSDIKLTELYIRPAIVALFENVMTSCFSLFTSANFSANTLITAANFTGTNIASLATALNTAKASQVNRSLIIPPTYADTMRKDTNITLAYAIGSAEYLKSGRPAPVHGFTPYEYNGTIPNNSENLAAVALAPQALCLAARQPQTPRNWHGAVLPVTDPTSGLTLQWRDFYDNQEQRTQLCLIYGVQIGVTGNGHRIRSA